MLVAKNVDYSLTEPEFQQVLWQDTSNSSQYTTLKPQIHLKSTGFVFYYVLILARKRLWLFVIYNNKRSESLRSLPELKRCLVNIFVPQYDVDIAR